MLFKELLLFALTARMTQNIQIQNVELLIVKTGDTYSYHSYLMFYYTEHESLIFSVFYSVQIQAKWP
jgi:hypothetical protein